MRNHNGVIAFSRRLFNEYKDLTPSEFYLQWGILCLMGWDEINHPSRYGIFKGTQKEIASFICKSELFVSRHLPSLLKKTKEFEKDGDFYEAFDYDKFTYKEACRREKSLKESEKQLEKDFYSKLKKDIAKQRERMSEWKEEDTISDDN